MVRHSRSTHGCRYGASRVPTRPIPHPRAVPIPWHRTKNAWPGWEMPPALAGSQSGNDLARLPRAVPGSCRAIPAELVTDNGTAIHPAAAGLRSLIYRLRRPAASRAEMPRNAFGKPQLPPDSPAKPEAQRCCRKRRRAKGREMPRRQRGTCSWRPQPCDRRGQKPSQPCREFPAVWQSADATKQGREGVWGQGPDTLLLPGSTPGPHCRRLPAAELLREPGEGGKD